MELADLNLITYVIKFNTGRYYAGSTEAGRSHSYVTNLAKAKIFNDPPDAIRVCKSLGKGKVTPVSKKVFFEATLKGER